MKKVIFYGVLIVACVFGFARSSERKATASILESKINLELSKETPYAGIENLSTSYEFVTKWGSYGSGNGQFINPRGITLCGDYVLVADSGNNRIQKFTKNGEFVMAWGSYGVGDGQFNNPQGIEYDGQYVYVTDSGNKRVQKFYSTGAFMTKWGDSNRFNDPTGIAAIYPLMASGATILVVDKGNNNVLFFGNNGTYLGQWGSSGSGDGQFRSPWGIGIVKSSIDPDVFDYRVLVADDSENSINDRIQKITYGGGFMLKWGNHGNSDGLFNTPTGISSNVVGEQAVFVTDRNNHRVQKFSSSGDFLTKWGSFGSGNGQFNNPWGIVDDGYYGIVFVVDNGNSRIQKFQAVNIVVTSPNGGESWPVSSVHSVTWTTRGTVGNVKIEYSTNNGTNWTTVIASTANTGTYAWTVPSTSSTQCLVRVSESSTGTPTDVSNAVFSIVSTILPPRIALSKASLAFGAVAGGIATSSQPVVVSNSGGGTLAWNAASNQNWLTAAPTAGTGTGTLIVSVNVSGLAAGTYTGTLSLTATEASNSPQTISITLTVVAGSGQLPFGSFATPTDGAAGITGAIPVTGWVLDDIETTKVEIKRDSVALDPPGAIGPDGLVYLGDAIFVEGARPDVETAYPGYPLNYRAGWGYMMLTNFLPNQGNGTFKIHAYAYDKEGNKVLLGSKTITCSNTTAVKPFGTIDTPAQGGDALGNAFVIFGWVLTPQPSEVPQDGSTITAWVDGIQVGVLKNAPNAYNQYRADIAGLFPGLKNSGGPVGFVYLNTTLYSNGVHTIYWIVTDDAGHADGIGSRYFNIMNTGTPSPQSNQANQMMDLSGSDSYDSAMNLPVSFEPRRVKKGFDLNAEPDALRPDEYGVVHINIGEVERVELDLKPLPGEMGNVIGASEYTGFLVVGNQLRPLPIGSTLDQRKGTFSWLPGPGFLGQYQFLFMRKDQVGVQTRINVNIRIIPKFGLK